MTDISFGDPIVSPQSTAQGIGRGLVVAMAAAAGIAVANIYYNQPMMGLIQSELPDPLSTLVPTATQIGYAAGLFLLVPLGDLIERKRLIAAQFVALALALAANAVAPNASTLVVASVLTGMMATVAQQIVPFAAHLAPVPRRGATVGMVMAGLLSGILLSRTLAGAVAAHFGWRAMFWLGVPLALGAAAAMALRLPRSRPEGGVSYPALIGSMWALWRELPALRLSTMTQSMIFAAFSVFWTILVFRLQEHFGLGPDVAGLFGIVGMVGILVAPAAGRMADRRGPRPVIVTGAVLVVVAWAIFGLWASIAGLVVGVILLDFASQAVLISNQHIVYALRPQARARLNTIFMGLMFVGGAIGSATAMVGWRQGGWTAVTALGLIYSGIAVALQLAARRTK
ncbi:MFS transporter [Bradyrhizobium sp. WD16]|uniref:MFS transporter n=1 Tax=Bradyrhizobium sp. WD16 TaxID=1521768 RepID=UPI00353256C5